MELSNGQEPTLVDVSDRKLLDLMISPEPELKAALQDLLAAHEQRRDVLLSWSNAMIDHRAADRDQRSDPAP